MDRRGVGRHQRVELAEAVGNGAAVETGGEFACVGIDIVDVADVLPVLALLVSAFWVSELLLSPLLFSGSVEAGPSLATFGCPRARARNVGRQQFSG